MMVHTGKFTIIPIISLFTALPLVAQVTVEVTLAGYNHRPIVHTPATGFIQVTFENDSLYVEGEFFDLRGSYWASFIHYGEPGKSGHRMFRLKAELGEDKHSGVFRKEDNAFKLTEAQMDALRKGHLYINISSSRFQHGEIRGQIPMM
ncbi:hypothetical protein BH23BAC3_BH23BAC3_33100 [soil metagenome]